MTNKVWAHNLQNNKIDCKEIEYKRHPVDFRAFLSNVQRVPSGTFYTVSLKMHLFVALINASYMHLKVFQSWFSIPGIIKISRESGGNSH